MCVYLNVFINFNQRLNTLETTQIALVATLNAPTFTPTPTFTLTATNSPTPTATFTATSVFTPTPSATFPPTATPTLYILPNTCKGTITGTTPFFQKTEDDLQAIMQLSPGMTIAVTDLTEDEFYVGYVIYNEGETVKLGFVPIQLVELETGCSP